ncbi:LXG domain-containing protein [Bacillus aquiflavi]|uniref:LXG domain-containing protein n=1 Tax=Bacillus aquiflavi TaxID=2672567 RepID=UPI001CA9DE4A|nr:LXG domain-containing protein [Bacillus aquiflavi]UAC48917.1 LXG domain-containing protein [Bacillus aquiflavi]
MKVLNVSEVNSVIDQLIKKKNEEKTQFLAIKDAVQKVIHLDDALKGKGGHAIREHFAVLHLPTLELFAEFLDHYIQELKEVKNIVGNYETEAGFVREDFLAHDVKNGITKVDELTHNIVESIRNELNAVSDIVGVLPIHTHHFNAEIFNAEQHVQKTIDELHRLDESSTATLTSSSDVLNKLSQHVGKMSGWTKNGIPLSEKTVDEVKKSVKSSQTLEKIIEEYGVAILARNTSLSFASAMMNSDKLLKMGGLSFKMFKKNGNVYLKVKNGPKITRSELKNYWKLIGEDFRIGKWKSSFITQLMGDVKNGTKIYRSTLEQYRKLLVDDLNIRKGNSGFINQLVQDVKAGKKLRAKDLVKYQKLLVDDLSFSKKNWNSRFITQLVNDFKSGKKLYKNSLEQYRKLLVNDFIHYKRNWNSQFINQLIHDVKNGKKKTGNELKKIQESLAKNLGGDKRNWNTRFVTRLVNEGVPLYSKSNKEFYLKNSEKFTKSKFDALVGDIKQLAKPKLKVAGKAFVEELKFWKLFKGWKTDSILTRAGKGAGILGLGLTVVDNSKSNFYNEETGELDFSKNKKKFAVDTAVDVGSGLAAMGAGAAYGSAVLPPPAGTVVGAVVGAGVFILINVKIPTDPPQSIVEMTKNIANKAVNKGVKAVKKAAKNIGDCINGIGKKLDKVFW